MLQSLMLGISLAVTGPALAAPPETPTPEEAEELFQSENWGEAAEAFEALASADPRDGGAWFKLGFALYKAGEMTDAAEAWQRALELDYYPMISAYNVAAAKAILGDVEGAFKQLERAVDLGFSDPELMRSDADFVGIRHDPRFAALVEQAERNARPCMYDSRFRAFDFWVGEWIVRDNAGKKVGSDRVKQAENGCALTAQWTDQFGRTLTSLTWFDPKREKWVQTRIGAGGHFVQAEGKMDRNGAMVLEGDLVLVDGDTRKVRTTWVPRPDGTVRVTVERSDDVGRTWLTTFEGHYERRDLYGRD